MTHDPARKAPAPRHRRPVSERRKLAVTLVAVLTLGAAGGTATWSAWTARTDNSGNTFTTSVVQLGDNDSGSAMVAVPGMEPGTVVSRCIRVDYTGTRTAAVKLYGAATAGDGLGDHLDLTVTRGTATGSFADCTTFTADAADHAGLGAGVLYDGVMSAYPGTWAAGIADPAAAWADGESHWYRFTVEVVDTPAAQGRSVPQTFSWDAR